MKIEAETWNKDDFKFCYFYAFYCPKKKEKRLTLKQPCHFNLFDRKTKEKLSGKLEQLNSYITYQIRRNSTYLNFVVRIFIKSFEQRRSAKLCYPTSSSNHSTMGISQN